MTAPTKFQRWMARHARVIVVVCVLIVAVSLAQGVAWWIDEGWSRGFPPILSTAGFIVFAITARACRRQVADYDSHGVMGG